MLSINRNTAITFPRIAVWLVGGNAGVWIILSLLSVILSPDSFKALLQSAFELPASLSAFSHCPWTVVTYAFAQLSFLHLLFNCIVIMCATVLLSSVAGALRIVVIYFAGAVSGGAAFIIASSFMHDEHGFLIGASASAMALIGAMAVLMPDRTVSVIPGFSMRLLWICVALIAMDLILAVAPFNPARFAHVGGACAGALIVFLHRFFSNGSARNNSIPDDVMKKVRQSGLSSLSAQERLRLFNFRAARKTK